MILVKKIIIMENFRASKRKMKRKRKEKTQLFFFRAACVHIQNNKIFSLKKKDEKKIESCFFYVRHSFASLFFFFKRFVCLLFQYFGNCLELRKNVQCIFPSRHAIGSLLTIMILVMETTVRCKNEYRGKRRITNTWNIH